MLDARGGGATTGAPSERECRNRRSWRLCLQRRGATAGFAAIGGTTGRHGRSWRRSRSLLCFCDDRFQHVARLGDVRQIDLGFDLFASPRGEREDRAGALRFRGTAEMGPHFFRFVLFE